MRGANSAGIHVIQIGFTCWPWDSATETFKPNYFCTDAQLDQLLAIDPKAVLLLGILTTPPSSWSGWATYSQWGKNEETLYSDGTTGGPSIASEVYLQGFLAGVTQMIRHYEASSYAPHILGYHIIGQSTGEWYPNFYFNKGLDYSPANLAGFQAWLRQRYGTDDALSQAWGRSLTIGTASIPVPEPARFPLHCSIGDAGPIFYATPTQQDWIDCSDYTSDIFCDQILTMAHAVREASNGKRLIAIFNGYIYTLVGSMHGQLRMNRLLASPDIDMISAPIEYNEDRMPGGPGSAMSARDSVALHGKLWMNEDDLTTYLAIPPDPRPDDTPPTTDFFETSHVLQRNLASSLVHRGGTWWMDFGAGDFNDESQWTSVMGDLGLPLFDELYAYPAPYRPEVAVITDERSVIYQASDCDFVVYGRMQVRNAIEKMGVSAGYYDLSDFLNGALPPAKVYFFANANYLTDRQIGNIHDRLRSEGATAIWQYASGYLGPGGPDVTRSSLLTGIQLSVSAGYSGSNGAAFLAGQRWGRAYGTPWTILTPRLIVTDLEATVLGRYWSDNAVSTASKRVNGFNSIFVGDIGLSAGSGNIIRSLLAQSGVHIWTTGDDVIHTDDRLLVVHAARPGTRDISLPAGLTAYPLKGGDALASSPQSLRVTFSRLGETQWFRLAGVLSITTAPALHTAIDRGPYFQPLFAANGRAPYLWTLDLGSLPEGLTLSQSGLISGSPIGVGSVGFTVSVTDADGNSASRTFSIQVVAPPTFASEAALPGGIVGAPYNRSLNIRGGVPPLFLVRCLRNSSRWTRVVFNGLGPRHTNSRRNRDVHDRHHR